MANKMQINKLDGYITFPLNVIHPVVTDVQQKI